MGCASKKYTPGVNSEVTYLPRFQDLIRRMVRENEVSSALVNLSDSKVSNSMGRAKLLLSLLSKQLNSTTLIRKPG